VSGDRIDTGIGRIGLGGLARCASIEGHPMSRPLVSAVIPTYHRRDDVLVAVRSVVEQTYPAESLEILVVDDGGSDDTRDALRAAFGDRVRYLWQSNRGVAAARNLGLAHARGELLALLDSDDTWHPTKVDKQVDLLEADPTLGLVITDVAAVTRDGSLLETWVRREQIPHDGYVLRDVVRNPRLVPSSVMFTRAVYAEIGGFSEDLTTAEDLEFHLRVATRFRIGVLEEALTSVMRGEDGLSQLSRTYGDYIAVMERFVAEHGAALSDADRDAALLHTYLRNARGLGWDGAIGEGFRVGAKAAARARSLRDVLAVLGVGGTLTRCVARRWLRWATLRSAPVVAATDHALLGVL
jgi:glycosyltransferase involved in cell wall biosynthesis